MTITAAGLAGGNNANSATAVTRSMGSVTAGQLIVVWGMKFSPSADAFAAGDCTQSAGTATIGAVTLDRGDGGDDGTGTAWCYSGVWSAIVTGSGTCTMQVGGAVAASYLLIGAEAFNGSWDSSRVEAVNGALVTTNSTSSSSTGNGTSAGAALFAAALQLNANSATTSTPDGAFTTVYENETGTDDNGSAIYRIVSTGTTDAGDWTHGTDHNGTAQSLVVYREGTTLDQEGFRFGLDDGSESAHTWSQNQDTNESTALDTTRLLRMLVNASGDPAAYAYTLRYQKNGAGGYVAVPVGASPTITVNAAITLGTDDAQQSGTTMTTTGTTIGADLDATTEYVGLRFQSIAVPNAATITNAYLRVVPSASTLDEPLVTIAGFAADNTGTFTTGASDITNRTITTATVAWSNTNLGADGATYFDTPALTTIVQEIVNRAGWASGNAMGFRIQGGSTTTRDLTIESFENTGNNPPLLVIEYTGAPELYVVPSANIAATGEDTTARLTAPSGKTTADFVTGRRWDDENGTDTTDITTDDYTEVEWALRVRSPAAITDYFDFRVYAGSSALSTYGVTPRWTISAGGDIVAAGSISITGAADLDATGTLIAAGTLAIAGAADLSDGVVVLSLPRNTRSLQAITRGAFH